MWVCKVSEGTAVFIALVEVQPFSSSRLLFIAVPFDGGALVAASFPSVTHQQRGETASKLKSNHNV